MCHSKIICIILICKIYDKSEKILYVIWWIEEIIRKINTMIAKIAKMQYYYYSYIILLQLSMNQQQYSEKFRLKNDHKTFMQKIIR